MKRTILATVVYVCVVLTGIGVPMYAYAQNEAQTELKEPLLENELFQYTIEEYNGEQAIIIKRYIGSVAETTFNIPETIDGIPVRVIDTEAFKNAQLKAAVYMPANMREVKECAFESSKIWAVYFEEGVVSIGNSAFSSCSSLSFVKLTNSVQFIGEFAFGGCSPKFEVETPEDSYAYNYVLLSDYNKNSFQEFSQIYYEVFHPATQARVFTKNKELIETGVMLESTFLTEGEEYEKLVKSLDGEAYVCEFHLKKDGATFELEGERVYYVQLPAGTADPWRTKAYFVEQDGSLTEVKAGGGTGEYIGYAYIKTDKEGKFVLITPHMYGDLDGDYEVTAKDALFVLKISVKLQPWEGEMNMLTADVVRDKEINAEDALAILKKTVKLYGRLPCEPDPWDYAMGLPLL